MQWNETGDTYSLRYRHSQSSLKYQMKGVQVGGRLIIHGMGLEVKIKPQAGGRKRIPYSSWILTVTSSLPLSHSISIFLSLLNRMENYLP